MPKEFSKKDCEAFITAINKIIKREHGAVLSLHSLNNCGVTVLDDRMQKQIAPYFEQLDVNNLLTVATWLNEQIEKENALDNLDISKEYKM